MGPISTGLGEVFMWTVEYDAPTGASHDHRRRAGLAERWLLSHPGGQRLTNDVERAAYLRTVQDWIIRPQLKGLEGVAGVDAIGGYVKQYHVQPDPMKLVAYGLTFRDIIEALERNNVSIGAGYIEHKGEAYIVQADGRIANRSSRSPISSSARTTGRRLHPPRGRRWASGQELRTGQRQRKRRRGRRRHGPDADRRKQPHRCRGG